MHGWLHIETLGIHFFYLPNREFIIKLLPDGSGAFTLDGIKWCNVVNFPSPHESVLGAAYQSEYEILGYSQDDWFANCAHEMLHIWYCDRYTDCLSKNHSMLMGLCSANIAECDDEEIIVTSLQVFANTGKIPRNTIYGVPNLHGLSYKLAKQFHDWIAKCTRRSNVC